MPKAELREVRRSSLPDFCRSKIYVDTIHYFFKPKLGLGPKPLWGCGRHEHQLPHQPARR